MQTRYLPGQPVRLNLTDTNELLSASILQFEGKTAELKLDRTIPANAAIRIDLEDSVLLGELSAVERRADGHVANVTIRDAFPVLSDLGRLVTAVLSGGKSVVPAVDPAHLRISSQI